MPVPTVRLVAQPSSATRNASQGSAGSEWARALVLRQVRREAGAAESTPTAAKTPLQRLSSCVSELAAVGSNRILFGKSR